jgi:hypothetical protein
MRTVQKRPWGRGTSPLRTGIEPTQDAAKNAGAISTMKYIKARSLKFGSDREARSRSGNTQMPRKYGQ